MRSVHIIIASTLLLAAAPARAQEQPQELYRQALESFRLARFKQSLQLLERARRLARDARLLGRVHLHIGINHAVFGRAQPARDAFRAALTRDATLDVDPRRYKQSIVEHFVAVRRTLRGELVVEGGEPGAAVTLDGAAVGATPFRGQVAIGRRALAVRTRDGRRGFEREVVITVDGETRVAVALARLRGTLTVRTRPAGAEVVLDGKPLGRTPLASADVDAGPHRLALRLTGHRDELLSLEVGAGRGVEVERELAPAAAVPDIAVSPPAPARRPLHRRWWFWTLLGAAVVGGTVAAIAMTTGGSDRMPYGPDGRYEPGSFGNR